MYITLLKYTHCLLWYSYIWIFFVKKIFKDLSLETKSHNWSYALTKSLRIYGFLHSVSSLRAGILFCYFHVPKASSTLFAHRDIQWMLAHSVYFHYSMYHSLYLFLVICLLVHSLPSTNRWYVPWRERTCLHCL